MYLDRFDICEAWYLYLSHWHGGQGSREYARLSRMFRYFQPRQNLSVATLTDNGRAIYRRLSRAAKRRAVADRAYVAALRGAK